MREMTDSFAKFSTFGSNVPRVVAAKVKIKCVDVQVDRFVEKPRISGDLRVVEKCSQCVRYAEVRDGNLLLYKYVHQLKEFDRRIPLHNLSINLDFSKHSSQFSLTRYSDLTPLATFQVANHQEYEQWLKALAVEIIRQTPLNILKFLDILFIDDVLRSKTRRATRALLRPMKLQKEDVHCRGKLESRSSSTLSWPNDSQKINPSYDFLHCDFHSLPLPSRRSDSPASIRKNVTKSKLVEEIRQKFETPEAKTKNKIRRSESLRACVSFKCMNLVQKFKKLSCKETDSGPAKVNRKSENWLRKKHEKCWEREKEIAYGDECDAEQEEEVDVVSGTATATTDPARAPSSLRVRKNALLAQADGALLSPDNSDVEEATYESRLQCGAFGSSQIPELVLQNGDASILIRLLTKCQIDQHYVPVREKRILFESLNRFSFSVDNLKRRQYKDWPALSRRHSVVTLMEKQQAPVKEIKRYFESLKDEPPARIMR